MGILESSFNFQSGFRLTYLSYISVSEQDFQESTEKT
mgnify:CR=1 FL=1